MTRPANRVLPGGATRALLAGVRRRRLLQQAIAWLCRASLLAATWLVVVGLVDRWQPLAGTTRAGSLVALALALLVGAVQLLRRLQRQRADPLFAARTIERLHPPLRDRLVTLLAPAASSPALLWHLAGIVERQCEDLRASRLVPTRDLLAPLRLLAAPLLVLSVLALLSPAGTRQALARLAFPLRDVAPPVAWTIVVTPGDVALAPGRSLRIEARRLPRNASGPTDSAPPRVAWQSGGIRRAETMTPAADGFVLTIDGLGSDAWYEVEWDGRRSPRHHVRLLHPPGVRSMTAQRRIGNGAAMLDLSGGRLAAPVGSVVELAIDTTRPIESASLESGSTRLPGTLDDTRSRATFVLPIERDGTWRLRLEGPGGLESDPRLRIELSALADDPPIVRSPTVLLRSSLRGQVRLPYLASDDHGLASLRLLRGRHDVVLERPIEPPGSRVMQGLAAFDPAPLAPAGVALFRLEASDSRGSVVLGEPLVVLHAAEDIGVFDQLRPVALEALDRSLAAAVQSMQRLEQAASDPATMLERRDESAEQLSRCIERLTVAATDAGAPLDGPLAALADRLATLRREVLELPPEPARAPDVARLRHALAQERTRASALRRAALAWLVRADRSTVDAATTRPSSSELSAALDRARRESQAWARALGVRLDDRELTRKLDQQVAATSGDAAPDLASLLGAWRDGASSESIADRLLLRGRLAALSACPDATLVADAVTLARGVRAAGRSSEEDADRHRERLLADWHALQEARSAGAVVAAARVQRHLRSMGAAEPSGQPLLELADQAVSAGEPLLDLADRWRALQSVADRLDPADVALLRQRLLDEARIAVAELLPAASLPAEWPTPPQRDPAETLTRLAAEASALRLRDLLWQGGETTESLRAALNPEPSRGLPRALALLTERVGRLLDTGTDTPGGSHGDDEALRVYFRLLSRESGN